MTEGVLPRIEASLTAWGNSLDPIRFSQETGLVPGSIVRKGEPRPDGRGLFPLSSWALSVSEACDNTDQVVRKLLEVLQPKREVIRRIAARQDFHVEIVCRVTIHELPPALDLEAETLRSLAELGCRVLFDVNDNGGDIESAS